MRQGPRLVSEVALARWVASSTYCRPSCSARLEGGELYQSFMALHTRCYILGTQTRDIGFSQRQTLIADIGPPSLTHMASTIFLHGAHDQQVGAGDRSFAVRVDTLMDSIQLIRTDLRPIDGILRIQVDRCPIPLLVPAPRQCGAFLLSRAVPPSQPLTPSVGSTPEGVSLTPGLIITTAPGTEQILTRPRGAPSMRGHAGSVSLHAHIPGDIASFTTQHGAEGAVLTTTSQREFRSLVYL